MHKRSSIRLLHVYCLAISVLGSTCSWNWNFPFNTPPDNRRLIITFCHSLAIVQLSTILPLRRDRTSFHTGLLLEVGMLHPPLPPTSMPLPVTPQVLPQPLISSSYLHLLYFFIFKIFTLSLLYTTWFVNGFSSCQPKCIKLIGVS